MQPFTVKCFGVGDGWPCADRRHASFLYRFGKSSVLVDCGEPIDASYKATSLSYESMDGILLSHLHSDHVGGFFMLMQGLWLEGRRKDLPVYLPAGAIKPLRQMLNAVYIYDELLPFRLQFRPIDPNAKISIGEVKASAFNTSHLNGIRARFGKKYGGDYSAFGFVLESGGRRVGHSADLGKPDDLEPILTRPLDLLVCELAHFSAEDMFVYLRGRKIKRVIFVHLARHYWDNLAHTKRLAAKILDIPHAFPHDQQELSF
jgi:Cft2 family RNA processing exonuclease